MYLKLCNTPPLIALHKSSVVVSGWIFPKYTVLFNPWTPAAVATGLIPFIPFNPFSASENGIAYGVIGDTADARFV